MILAIGNSGVYEVEAFTAVNRFLSVSGHKVVLFKQDKCLDGEYLAFEVAGNRPCYYIVIDGVRYCSEHFSAVWYMHPHLPESLLKYEPAEYRQFVHKQFFDLRQGLWSVFRDKKWINNPLKAWEAENKIFQLQIAVESGFLVPDTLITSDPVAVTQFYHKHSQGIIVKILGASPMVGKVIMTNVVTDEYLRKIESVKLAPSIFQSLVKKDYELRITVVGEKLFPLKIYSQEDHRTSVDWRTKPTLNDFEVKMEPTVLPHSIEKAITIFMQRMGLRYGCIDAIVTPEGNFVFLEVNPNGQWYFAQVRTGVQIAGAIAQLLIS